ncbi:hypothetical protein SAMN05421788_102262 [Filimonas lacunae]|uniref:SusD family protein n=1 Tax=Filimonas lacunae TaxID=477680 RepID=A0A173MHY9_9BACT|nr:hypothetical protein [Filimonas lacunae]BAV07110.1 hypothetical protein FLA_3130 [Filimonas lacunae]SIS94886.1 hypothetical protein SAMN05421788_102262 [Filimonas lacunae]
MKLLIRIIGLLYCCAAVTACNKTFDKLPVNELDVSNAYRNVDDANSAVMGIYGKFMGLADRYVILNELRGDLLEYTDNADEYLRQISTHSVTADNPYASPRPFYELIINCNDVLKNFTLMYQSKRLKEDEYNQRYSDIACLRSFLYLQLGIHYGDEVRYITDPLENVSALSDAGKFPKVPFNALLDSLINFTEAIPFKTQYTAQVSGTVGPVLNMTLDGIPTNTFFIQKKMLLGELYLWKGNYTKAATYYREVMEIGTPSGLSEGGLGLYKLAWGGANHYVTYYVVNNAPSLAYDDGWRMIFNRGYDASYGYEWLWALPYDSKFKPDNPLIQLFSPIGGKYLLKPSQAVVDNWHSQLQNPRFGVGTISYGQFTDAREPLSIRNLNGQPVVMKYLYNYIDYATNTALNPFTKNGKFYLFRQTQLHLHFAEAANRDGYYKLASAISDQGLGATFAPPVQSPAITDMTLWQNSLMLPAPYNFDARNSDNVPYFRGMWYRHIGVRRRVGLVPNVVSAGDSLISIENNIINEEALENAFEGTRWPDLLRIALRRNDPAFLADKVYAKLLKDNIPNAAAIREKLMQKNNWYLPFKL